MNADLHTPERAAAIVSVALVAAESVPLPPHGYDDDDPEIAVVQFACDPFLIDEDGAWLGYEDERPSVIAPALG